MKNSKPDYYNPNFSHIYVEKAVMEHPGTRRILSHFPRGQVVLIDRYKDIFNRRGQVVKEQHLSQALILAKKEPPFFYEGAPVCQDFGNANFYYCSSMRGCVYSCSYCFLKGMYPSGHMVIFVNLEDYFRELDILLKRQPMYLCISYDTDLLAMEPVTGYVKQWVEFANAHEGLTLEVRTKSARKEMWEELPHISRVIYAFSLAPQAVIEENEQGTPTVHQRIACAVEGLKKGYPVRLCFDPMLYQPGWEKAYGGLTGELDEEFSRAGLSMRQLVDVSVGCFRISQDYLKKLRRMEPLSATVQFPFVNEGGVYKYPAGLKEEMEGFLIKELAERMDKEKIYCE